MKLKKIINNLSNNGNATKSAIFFALLAAAEKNNVPIAKFDFDIDHQSLYSAYCTRNGDGDPIATQDPINGCPLIDINKDPETILRIVKSDCPLILTDLPARAIYSIYTAMGARDGVETLYNSYFEKRAMATHIVPLVDGDKSLKTLESIYSSVDAADLDNDVKVELIIVKNIGFMDATGGPNFTNAALDAYSNSQILKAINSNDKFIFKEVEFKAQLNSQAKDALVRIQDDGSKKAVKLLEILADPSIDTDVEALIRKMVKDGERLLKAIQS